MFGDLVSCILVRVYPVWGFVFFRAGGLIVWGALVWVWFHYKGLGFWVNNVVYPFGLGVVRV